MTCDQLRPQLTAYLEGELEDDRGGAVRGHLRGCDACRAIAADESSLRDALRNLPPLDPPPSLWARVQAELAEKEARDAETPAWRRALARWLPVVPRYAFGALAAAVVVIVIWSRTHHGEDAVAVAPPPPPPVVERHAPPPPPASTDDVTADLAAESGHIGDEFRQATEELLAQVPEIEKTWTDEQREQFATRIAALRATIASATEGRPRRRAYEAMVRYLEGALTRDDVALAGGVR